MPDEPVALADRAQLVVGEVARRGAQRVRAGVRGDERARAQLGDVPEALRVEVRDVDEDPQLAARADQRAARVGQPRALVGRAGEAERDAGRERVRPAPDEAERAQAGRVEHEQLVERRPDRLGALGVQHRGEPVAVEVGGRARDAQAPAGLALEPEQERDLRERLGRARSGSTAAKYAPES